MSDEKRYILLPFSPVFEVIVISGEDRRRGLRLNAAEARKVAALLLEAAEKLEAEQQDSERGTEQP